MVLEYTEEVQQLQGACEASSLLVYTIVKCKLPLTGSVEVIYQSCHFIIRFIWFNIFSFELYVIYLDGVRSPKVI